MLSPTNTSDATTAKSGERYLLDLWTELFGAEVKPSDNFFDLGGNSMLAVQMAERVAKDTGVRVKLIQLAALSLADIAAELPTSTSGSGAVATGIGSRLMRKVRGLFGARAAAGA